MLMLRMRHRNLIVPATSFDPSASGIANPLWEAVGDAAETLTGTRTLLPMLIPFTTDARFFRHRGVVAYGVGLFDDAMRFGDMMRLFHGHDERVSVGSVARTTEMLAHTIERFGSRIAGAA